jgi:hypothetical protein
MNDDDESPVEAADRIVSDALGRHLETLSAHLMQLPQLFEGLAERMTGLVEMLEPWQKVAEDINRHEDETIAIMEEQMPF